MRTSLIKKNSNLFIDNRGSLFSFENSNFKRVFFINGKKNKIRGNHGHKLTNQLIVNISAKVTISIINKKRKKIITLRSAGEFINIPPKNWVSIKFLKTGYLSVICDRKYSKNDYIHHLSQIKS